MNDERRPPGSSFILHRSSFAMWSLKITTSRLRPINAASIARMLIVAAVFFAFLWGDYALFRRLFRATAQVEEATPLFALGLLRNLLAMVLMVATIVL